MSRQSMGPKSKAFLVVIFFGFVFGGLWVKYYDFLSQGRKAPSSALILNDIEKNGMPEFEIETLKGEALSLEKFKGRVVILNFWASWCDPCVAEFPSLLKLIQKFDGKVVLLAISADYERQDIDTFLKAFKIDNPSIYVAWDKDLGVAKKFGTFRLPESYIIGVNGKLVRKIAGVDDWSTKDAYDFFKSLLSSGS